MKIDTIFFIKLICIQYIELLLIIAIFWSIRQKQPGERELLCDSVTKDQLGRNVQKHTIVVLVRVEIQGTIRHRKEILCGQTESVGGSGGDGGTCLLQLNF